VDRKVDLKTVPEVAQVMSAVESRLAGNGRLLIRYSGTEPLLRIMIEGQDQREISAWADEIADAVKQHLVAHV
jgi:phosphoglucosamine mutase